MEKLIHRSSLRISAFAGFFLLFLGQHSKALDTKRFDAPKPKRPAYLTFAKPAPLRFTISPLPVDRLALVLPPAPLSAGSTVSGPVLPDQNATAAIPQPPPASGLDGNSSTSAPEGIGSLPFIPRTAPSETLPLSDPFEGMDGFGPDSTDELLRLLETSEVDGRGSLRQPTPFVPPYTVAPDGMRMSNKATYRRVQR